MTSKKDYVQEFMDDKDLYCSKEFSIKGFNDNPVKIVHDKNWICTVETKKKERRYDLLLKLLDGTMIIEKVMFVPSNNETYFFVNNEGVDSTRNEKTSYDLALIQSGNCFERETTAMRCAPEVRKKWRRVWEDNVKAGRAKGEFRIRAKGEYYAG